MEAPTKTPIKGEENTMKTRMRGLISIALVLALSMAAVAIPLDARGQERDKQTVTIRGGTIVDGTGSEPVSDGLVVIEGDRIVYVGPASEYQVPPGAKTIEASGGTIMPGIVDTHLHALSFAQVGDVVTRLRPVLQTGVTSVLANMPKSLLERSQEGEEVTFVHDRFDDLMGNLDEAGNHIPTVVPSYFVFGRSTPYIKFGMVVEGEDEARLATVAATASGAGVIAIDRSLSPAELQAVVATSHEAGAIVLITYVDAAMALASGADDWQHQTDVVMSESTIRDLVAGGFFLESYSSKRNSVRAFLDAGGKLKLGTSADSAGFQHAYEMLHMVRTLGMTPMEAIVAATASSAQSIGIGETRGTLEAGKFADVIVLAGDPLQDLLLGKVNALESLVAVIKNGEVVLEPE